LYQNYPLDLIMLNFGAIDDGVLHFSERVSAHWGRAA
jgi:hypothetical protein